MIQKDLANKIGVQEQQIQRYEASQYSSASFDRLRSIASALNIDIRLSSTYGDKLCLFE
jgi:HTH-type transcriptional regulator/antitoxin HigA